MNKLFDFLGLICAVIALLFYLMPLPALIMVLGFIGFGALSSFFFKQHYPKKDENKLDT